MLDFKNKLDRIIADYFIKYNVNPHPVNDGKIVIFDPENQIHYTNSIISASNLNVAVSKNLTTKVQREKALEIIKTFQNNKMPFTWCVISNSQEAKEMSFFLENGFSYTEKIIGMTFDLKNFNHEVFLNENEKIKQVETLEDVEKFRNIIKHAFPKVLIDLQKYYGLYELGKTQPLNYQVYLTVNDVPASTGQFYFQDNLAIIDDIGTLPDFQRQGLAKKMLNYLLATAKKMGFEQAILIATPDGFPIYKKLGFKQIELYIDVYEINY